MTVMKLIGTRQLFMLHAEIIFLWKQSNLPARQVGVDYNILLFEDGLGRQIFFIPIFAKITVA